MQTNKNIANMSSMSPLTIAINAAQVHREEHHLPHAADGATVTVQQGCPGHHVKGHRTSQPPKMTRLSSTIVAECPLRGHGLSPLTIGWYQLRCPKLKMCKALLQLSGVGSGSGYTPPKTYSSPRWMTAEWYEHVGASPESGCRDAGTRAHVHGHTGTSVRA